jgi:hypothetical protein
MPRASAATIAFCGSTAAWFIGIRRCGEGQQATPQDDRPVLPGSRHYPHRAKAEVFAYQDGILLVTRTPFPLVLPHRLAFTHAHRPTLRPH